LRSAVDIRESVVEDAVALAPRLRRADLAELRAAGHDIAEVPIREGIVESDWAMTATVDGEIACVFGLARTGTMLAPIGVPWMLGTDLVTANARALMVLAGYYIAQMLQEYEQLVNIVHAPNRRAIGWLRRMGFHVEQARPMGPHGELFHVFRMNRNV